MNRPSFLIVGAQKSGTTTLFDILSRHPQVFMPDRKEVNFFAGEEGFNRPHASREGSLNEYLELFTAAGAGGRRAWGECSPAYLYAPEAPELIWQNLPGVKLLAILRQPAERAYSGFLHQRRAAREPLADFAQALAAEADRIGLGWPKDFHYKSRGFYYRQLMNYLKVFPRDQLLVTLFDDLTNKPSELLDGLCDFIGVDSSARPLMIQARNESFVPRSAYMMKLYGRMNMSAKMFTMKHLPAGIKRLIRSALTLPPPRLPEAVKGELTASTYRDDILGLQDLLKRDMSAWLNF